MDNNNCKRHNIAWFALVDSEHCRLLCCRLTKQGSHHVDEHGQFQNTLPEAEHARPMSLGGTTHYVEENERRFSGETLKWLKDQIDALRIDHLTLFAPARMLGAIRKASDKILTGEYEELQGSLMRLETGQLAEHPMIRRLVKQPQVPHATSSSVDTLKKTCPHGKFPNTMGGHAGNTGRHGVL